MRPEVEPILLDTNSPALAQIAAELRGRSALDAVHIIAHGAPGEVSFSAGRLSIESIDDYADDLAAIGDALTEEGDLRLWSCQTGAGASGRAFLGELSQAAAVSVAAATGLVGAKALGGSWSLDGYCGTKSAEAPLTPDGKRSYLGLMATATWKSGTTGELEHCWGLEWRKWHRRRARYRGFCRNILTGTTPKITVTLNIIPSPIASLTVTFSQNGSHFPTLTVTHLVTR